MVELNEEQMSQVSGGINCIYAGLEYSPGAIIQVGDYYIYCTGAGGWSSM